MLKSFYYTIMKIAIMAETNRGFDVATVDAMLVECYGNVEPCGK